MKHLVENINDSLLFEKRIENKYDAEYTQLAKDYLEILGEKEVANRVDKAVDETNKLLAKIRDAVSVDIAKDIIKGQALGRIVEYVLSRTMNGCGGVEFKQGAENANEKDLECVKVPRFVDDSYNDLEVGPGKKFIVNNPHSYGIELKCATGAEVSGNKAYAIDVATDKSKKDKWSFYILITNLKLDNNFQVDKSKYKVEFCYLTQSDWSYGNAGNFTKQTAIDSRRIRLK